MKDQLEGYPVITEIPVAWGEMDALNHVNNVVYFRYFETARIDYFQQLALMAQIQQSGIGPVVSETQCKYKRPVTFPDTLSVGSRICELGDDRFTMEYIIYSQRQGKITTEGSAKVVMVDFNKQQKASIPATIRQKITELEASSTVIAE
ncbi:thioesterase [Photobacterium jeanii]|uniref:Thioesterase n=1 Tax=Photobacterium jeanii TaxID=858640 RepID=A0A178K156_9GAMM|nr:thioesterase family protein [Photobacterium jeanii]OAN11040.1 thioesterase [Photobacterium jeanii]PST90553.1 acyl-CoA thioesterase [Photobacterium jeanii]